VEGHISTKNGHFAPTKAPSCKCISD